MAKQKKQVKRKKAKKRPILLSCGSLEIIPIPAHVKRPAKGREITILDQPFKMGFTSAEEWECSENSEAYTVSQELTKRELALIIQAVGSYRMDRIEAFLETACNVHDVKDLKWTKILSYMENYLHLKKPVIEEHLEASNRTGSDERKKPIQTTLREYIKANFILNEPPKKVTTKLDPRKRSWFTIKLETCRRLMKSGAAKGIIMPSTRGGGGVKDFYDRDELDEKWPILCSKIPWLGTLEKKTLQKP